MVLFFEILDGRLKGKKYRVLPDLAVGRREGQIRLEDDAKVSGLHARIEHDNKGQMILMDQGSANGLVIGKRRVKKVALLPGVQFRIGETSFKVVEMNELEAEEISPLRVWQNYVREELSRDPIDDRNMAAAGQTFTPAVQLEFIQGMQTNQIQVLGYGPRFAGHGHLDIELSEPDAPETAFEIQPGPGVALFKDYSRGKVLLNQNRVEDLVVLSEGDLISIGSTVMRVRYI